VTPETIKVSDVVYREDLYPRLKSDPTTIQRYAENLDVLPPIEINQHKILIDGFHRWTAHRSVEAETIKAVVTETASDAELLGLAIERNAAHGLQMSGEDKRQMALTLYSAKAYDRAGLQKLLSVSEATLSRWLSDIDKADREKRKRKIQELWLAGHTAEEITMLLSEQDNTSVERTIKEYRESSTWKKSGKVTFSEEDYKPPLFNVWTFAKKTNEVGHFGNSEQRIVDNLLYLYTEPFDIVIDPFAGSGSTIDVCQKRMRRYWASDRKPIVMRESEIRTLDIVQELPPLNKRWNDVALTYLDPPYWKQAENQYSKDAEDLANMPLAEFTEKLSTVVNRIAEKQSRGALALLIQPTQWKSEGREFADHVLDIIRSVKAKRLVLENRVSCPYSTEQYNAQQVEWAKAEKKLLVISRELIIWRVVK